ncbi:MAG: chorismate mutase [Mycobacteriales bacterium]
MTIIDPATKRDLGTNTATGRSDDPILDLRERIDGLDAEIVRLVNERATLSALVQRRRMTAGGVRLELSREREIMARYGADLGPSGTAIADAILRACRG